MAEVGISEIMAEIEEMFSRHYSAYAEKFQDHRDFWLDLAAQELDHAQWIRDLYTQTKKGFVIFNENRFNKQSLQEFHGRIELMLSDFRANTNTMKEALSNSLNIENFLLEKNYFQVFSSDTPELKALLVRLAKETQFHRDRIKELLKDFS